MQERTLYVVSTPIGHLSDITYRAVEVLGSVELVLAESPLTTKKLLDKYALKTPMRRYNAPLERRLNPEALWRRHSKIALVSEAGTPCVLDPGRRLVGHCLDHGIEVVPVPGACALSALLSVCGMATSEVLFLGFLPNKKGSRRNALEKALTEHKRTIVLYESRHRLENTLEILKEFDDNLTIVAGREMTKKYEEFTRGSPSSLLEHYRRNAPRGEFVLAVDNEKRR